MNAGTTPSTHPSGIVRGRRRERAVRDPRCTRTRVVARRAARDDWIARSRPTACTSRAGHTRAPLKPPGDLDRPVAIRDDGSDWKSVAIGSRLVALADREVRTRGAQRLCAHA